MKEKFLRFIYKKYPKEFSELMVENFYGEIPSSVREPSIEFLSNARGPLEKFFTIQAYQIQRRSIQDTKNSMFYSGMLAHIRSLLSIIQKSRPIIFETEMPEVEKDPIDKVNNFVKAYKDGKKTNA